MKTRDELKKIAVDLLAGKIWTDREDASSFSPILQFISNDKKAQLKMHLGEEGLIFEYIEKATHWNGETPFFNSCQTLGADEFKLFSTILDEERRVKRLMDSLKS